MKGSGSNIRSEIERFLTLFGTVRQKCGSAPNRLRLLAENDSAFLASLLGVFDAAQSLDRSLERHTEKYLIAAPKDVLGALKDWHDRWEPLVSQVTAVERNKRTKELIEVITKAFETGGDAADELLNQVYQKGIADHHPFDPSQDDAAKCIEGALLTSLDFASPESGLILDGDNPTFDKCEKGWGAWRYLAAVLCLNLGDAVRRWNQLDLVAIPKHVSDAHGLMEPGSVYDLLREAHIAFAMGSNMAATALCRAILERVLVRNYRCEAETLKDVISIAEQKYPFLRQLQLDRLRSRANETLHPKTGMGMVSNEDTARFLSDLKTLIERAPLHQEKTP